MLSSTHFVNGFTGASGGLRLSPYNPTMVMSNAIHMVCAIDTLISTSSCDGSSNSIGNTTLQLNEGKNFEGGGTNMGSLRAPGHS